jgi:hypothetical protein
VVHHHINEDMFRVLVVLPLICQNLVAISVTYPRTESNCGMLKRLLGTLGIKVDNTRIKMQSRLARWAMRAQAWAGSKCKEICAKELQPH